MAGRWLLWVGLSVGLVFVVLASLAALPLVGLFLGAVIFLAAASAVDPRERQREIDHMRQTCNRLPFCDCGTG